MSVQAINRVIILDMFLKSLYGKNQAQIDSRKEFILTLSTGSRPSTWQTASHRKNFDMIGNWLYKELNRCGDTIRNSERRCDLYLERRALLEPANFKRLWENAWENQVCAITGTFLNFWLGETKILTNEYLVKTYGEPGISPSLERTDPNKGYTIDNIEIISSFENIGRNQGVNFQRLRQERKCLNSIKAIGA